MQINSKQIIVIPLKKAYEYKFLCVYVQTQTVLLLMYRFKNVLLYYNSVSNLGRVYAMVHQIWRGLFHLPKKAVHLPGNLSIFAEKSCVLYLVFTI